MRTFSSVLPFTRRFGVRGVTCMTNGAQGGEGVVSPDPSQDKDSLCVKIADTISDYRKGDGISPQTADDVGRWAAQFDSADQLPILGELAHVLGKMYFSEATVREFIRIVVSSPELTGGDPAAFWRNAEILDLQLAGSRSQRDMLALFDEELRAAFGFGKDACKGVGKTFVYLDDGVFSGGQATDDIVRWLKENGQAEGFALHLIVIGLHDSGKWKIKRAFQKIASSRGRIQFWRLRTMPSWRRPDSEPDKSAVLWPHRWPEGDSAVEEWLAREPENRDDIKDTLRHEGRNPDLFKSESGRQILEQALLRKGADICCRPVNRNRNFRPLGAQYWPGWGFGALFVTYRNCPNNCPLAFWWNTNGWIPLFPRRHRGEG